MAAGARRKGSAPRKITPEDLESALDRGKPAAVYVLAGPEAVLRDRCLAALKRRCVLPEFELFNYRILPAAGLEGEGLVQELRSLPMGGGSRLVVLQEAERLVKDQITALAAYAAEPAPETCLVLLAATVKETLAKALSGAAMVDCSAPWEDRIPGLLSGEARRLGVRLDPAAAEAIVARCGRDLSRAFSELGKVAIAAGEGGRVTVAMVEGLAAGEAQGDVFKVASALARGDVSGAIAAARGYLESEERGEPRVLYELGMHLRRILAALSAIASGRTPAEAARAAGVFWKDVQPFAGSLSGWSEARLRGAYQRLLATDRRVKRGSEGLPAIEAYLWSLHGDGRGAGGRGARAGAIRSGAPR